MAMSFNMKLSHNDATEVRIALVDRVSSLKVVMQARLASEEERLDAARSVNTLERILRTEYGDYEESSTAPAVEAPKSHAELPDEDCVLAYCIHHPL